MKELKFRVWNNSHNEFIRPDYGLIGFCYPLDGRISVLTTNGDPTEDCIIEQYTGLKDKNGKEIYEGDIVEYTTYYYGKEKRHRKAVEWSEWYSDDFGEPHNIGYSNLSECMEVIGNIHENADLLEEE